MTWTRLIALAVPFVAVVAAAPGPADAAAQKWYEKAVKGVSVAVEPAEAKPGQTVTVKLTVALHDGYTTYPLAQPEKAAANFVNVITFPKPGDVIFVGTASDPDKLPTKAEPDLGIKELRYATGTVTFTRKAVVSPKAAAGEAVVKATIKLSVCDKNTCYVKDVPVEAKVKVFPGPAAEVEAAYRDEVTKALMK
jgi:DsbC/DsbD-like thiol-disulfide interchange protein